MNWIIEGKKRLVEQQAELLGGRCEKHWRENRVVGVSRGEGGNLADRMEARSADLFASRARTREHKVDTPHQPTSPPLHMPSRLSFST